MTNEMFWRLYNGGEINVKCFEFEKEKKHVEVSAFEYADKYFLRICTTSKPYTLDRTAECGKRYRMGYHSCTIKEFDNRESANRYFKAVRANA